jgi:hypothetical protein
MCATCPTYLILLGEAYKFRYQPEKNS